MIQILELFEDVKVKVSNDGRIFTLDHKRLRKNGRIDNRKGKELSPAINRYGYKQVVLSRNGIRKTYAVHPGREGCLNGALYHQAGNSIPVTIFESIFRKIFYGEVMEVDKQLKISGL